MRKEASFDWNSRNLMKRSHLVDQKNFMPLNEVFKDDYIASVSILIDNSLNNDWKFKMALLNSDNFL